MTLDQTFVTAKAPGPSPRGKRRLNFSSQNSRPLRGKVFFLDLHGYGNQATIKKEITERGGVVEEFFHNAVKYLVTNKSLDKRGVAYSPVSLSPNTFEGGVNGQGTGGVASPLSISPCGVGVVKPPSQTAPVSHGTRSGTRSAKMLAASFEKRGGQRAAMDVLKMAKKWKIKVITLDDLIKELRKFKPLPSNHQYKDVSSVRKLKAPFLKVEDLSGKYRPLVYETDVWPVPQWSCPPNACPFETLKRNGHAGLPSRATGGARLTQDMLASCPVPPGPTTTTTITARKKSGYCECCSIRYDNLKQHLQSQQHRKYALNDANFASLDKFIQEKGLGLKSFLESMAASVQEDCSVLLITPPTSPASTPPPQDATLTSGLLSHKNVPLDDCVISAGLASPKRGFLCLTPIMMLGKGSPQKTVLLGKGSPQKNKRSPCKGSPQKTESTTPFSPINSSRLCHDNTSAIPFSPNKGIYSSRLRHSATPSSPNKRIYSSHLRRDSPKKGIYLSRLRHSATPSSPNKGIDSSRPRRHLKRDREQEEETTAKLPRQGSESSDDCIHETPVKKEGPRLVGVGAPTLSPLCNIRNLILRHPVTEGGVPKKEEEDGSGRHKVDLQDLLDEVTRDSPLNSSMTLSPGTSPSTRRSPRLLRRGEERKPALIVESGPVITLPPPSPLTTITLHPQVMYCHGNPPLFSLPLSHQGHDTTPSSANHQDQDTTPPCTNRQGHETTPPSSRHSNEQGFPLLDKLGLCEDVPSSENGSSFEGFSLTHVRGTLPKFAHSLLDPAHQLSSSTPQTQNHQRLSLLVASE